MLPYFSFKARQPAGKKPARPSRFVSLFSVLAMAVGALSLAAPAHAAWESIGACPTSGFVKLKASERQALRIAAGFEGEIEVFGHLLDTVRDVNLTGITGREISVVRGDSGFVNGGAGVVGRTGPNFCALGSLVVKVKIPAAAARGTRGTLVIGGERISVEVVSPTFSSAWAGVNDSSTLSAETQAQLEANARNSAAQNEQACRTNAQTVNYQHCLANRPALVAERTNQCSALQNSACRTGAGNTTCVTVLGAPSPCDPLRSCESIRDSELAACTARGRPRLPEARTPRCLRDLGGRTTLMANGTLEITLPSPTQASDAALSDCISKGFDVDLITARTSPHFGPGGLMSNNTDVLEVGAQSGITGVTISGSLSSGTDGVLRLPRDIRQRLNRNGIFFGASGTITLRHRGIGSNSVGLGDSTTVLRYAIVPPPTQLVVQPGPKAPAIRRPF